MLTSFSIKNFRCFHDLTIDRLERINLIAGKNNVGKTSLLEAIHLHCLPDKPHLWIKVHKLRGIEDPLDAIEEIAEWNFHHGNHDEPIEFHSQDDQQVDRSTSFYLVDATTSREQFPEVEKQVARALPAFAGSDVGRLILRYSIGENSKVSVGSAGEVRHGGYQTYEAHVSGKIPILFLGSLISDDDRDIRNFGTIQKSKRLDEILGPLRHIESRLQGLSLVPFAGKPRIHADIDGFSQLVPLSQIGEGTRRLLSILLA